MAWTGRWRLSRALWPERTFGRFSLIFFSSSSRHGLARSNPRISLVASAYDGPFLRFHCFFHFSSASDSYQNGGEGGGAHGIGLETTFRHRANREKQQKERVLISWFPLQPFSDCLSVHGWDGWSFLSFPFSPPVFQLPSCRLEAAESLRVLVPGSKEFATGGQV